MGQPATYTYDGDGNRVQKMTGSTGTLYWRDSAGVTLIESDASGTAQHGYVFFAGRMIARNDLSPWSAHFYFSDHLGSSNVVTNATGTIEDESDFYPYGGEIVVTNTVPQNYKFTGKERDSESGLDNFGARYYASGMGRFMTPDWAARPTTVPYASFGDPQTLNLYTYVENGPVNRVDADGHGKDCTKSNNTRGCRPGADTDDGGQNTEQRDNNKSTTDAVKAAASQIESYGTISEPISPSTSGPAVTITYDKNVPAMRTKTQEYVEKVAETAGVESINISATTNGQHAPNSNHYNGTAVDINKVNGERVVNAATDPTVGSNVNSIQNAANSPKAGVAHENYGPAGLYKDGKQITNAKLQAEHENHIHITIPRIGP